MDAHVRCREGLLAAAFAVAVSLSPSIAPVPADGQESEGQDAPTFDPVQDPLPVAPPPEAIVLFDGQGTNRFVSMDGGSVNWPIEDGVLISSRARRRTNHVVSTLHFRDADIHVEFQLPKKGSGNSGVYIHGNYEFQIYNSFGKQEPGNGDMGAIYGFSKPLANACRKPGQWQVVDIRYRAPRRNDQGEIVKDGSITAWLNGVVVQDGTTFGEPRSPYHPFRYGTTPYLEKIYEQQKATSIGPLFLQDHDNPVRFRNVWVRPLNDRFKLYELDADDSATE
jgi:hypothetical protein